jgi:hypothetical protein
MLICSRISQQFKETKGSLSRSWFLSWARFIWPMSLLSHPFRNVIILGTKYKRNTRSANTELFGCHYSLTSSRHGSLGATTTHLPVHVSKLEKRRKQRIAYFREWEKPSIYVGFLCILVALPYLNYISCQFPFTNHVKARITKLLLVTNGRARRSSSWNRCLGLSRGTFFQCSFHILWANAAIAT